MTHNMTHNMTHTHTQMVAEVTVYETQFKYSSYLCRLHVLMYAVVHTHTHTYKLIIIIISHRPSRCIKYEFRLNNLETPSGSNVFVSL